MEINQDDLEFLRFIKEAGLEEELIEYSKEQEKLVSARVSAS